MTTHDAAPDPPRDRGGSGASPRGGRPPHAGASAGVVAAPRRAVTESEDRVFGPGWPLSPAVAGADPSATLPRVLWSPGARRWYFGAAFSMLWLIGAFAEIVQQGGGPVWAVLGIAVLVVFALAFEVAAPLSWSFDLRGRLLVCGALLVLSFALFPWLGWDVAGFWGYVGVIVGMSVLPWRTTWLLVAALAAVNLLVDVLQQGGWNDDVLIGPAILLSVSLMMAAFARTIAAVNQLRAAQDRIEVLAAERERGRLARDIHDILGHTLTVVTVKAELAGRLVDVDPVRARTEIGEVETLARGALADVRATVAGVRGVTISGELAAARVALSAAGVAAELPGSTDAVAPEWRELAGWVVREGVTNVVRHSGASVCRVTLGAHGVEVADDGMGPTDAAASSTGLVGLRERVEAAGGSLAVGRSDLGGFSLRATL